MKTVLLLAMALAPVAVMAQTPHCAAPATVPGLEAWSRPPAASPSIGSPARLALQPTGVVPLASGRPPKPGTYAVRLPLTISEGGNYRVALDAGAWIDLIRDGKPVASGAHGHGPPCSGIAKIVSFALRPGRYELQLSEAGAAQITVLIVPEEQQRTDAQR